LNYAQDVKYMYFDWHCRRTWRFCVVY